MKQLFIVFHSQSSHAEAIALALYHAAKLAAVGGEEMLGGEVTVRLKRCVDTHADDFLSADLVVFVTPENFAALAGGMKDMLDRVFYPLERAQTRGLAYTLLVSAGNDGTSTVEQVERILRGINAKPVQAPVILYGNQIEPVNQQLCELGQSLVVGLDMGVF